MADQNKTKRFNQVALPHLDAAYNLAKWLTQNPQDAEDVVQESFIKAFRHFEGFHGNEGKAWLLAIVRNTCYTWLQAKKNLPQEVFDEDGDHGEFHRQFAQSPSLSGNPEHFMEQMLERDLINKAMGRLPGEFREVLVLRELEGLSYNEIAIIIGTPIGTVMSRLARARGLMGELLARHFNQEPTR